MEKTNTEPPKSEATFGGTPYTISQLEFMMFDGVAQAVPCGCDIEPDGHCMHGNPSALIKAGII